MAWVYERVRTRRRAFLALLLFLLVLGSWFLLDRVLSLLIRDGSSRVLFFRGVPP